MTGGEGDRAGSEASLTSGVLLTILGAAATSEVEVPRTAGGSVGGLGEVGSAGDAALPSFAGVGGDGGGDETCRDDLLFFTGGELRPEFKMVEAESLPGRFLDVLEDNADEADADEEDEDDDDPDVDAEDENDNHPDADEEDDEDNTVL